METALLFDVARRLFIATDSSPLSSRTFELGADTMDMILDIASLYCRSGKAKSDPGLAPWGELKLSGGVTVTIHVVNQQMSLLLLSRSDSLTLPAGRSETFDEQMDETINDILKIIAVDV